MAEAYIQTRSDQANANIVESLERDNTQVEKLRTELADAIRRLENARPGSPAAAEASADQQLVNQQILALLTRIPEDRRCIDVVRDTEDDDKLR